MYRVESRVHRLHMLSKVVPRPKAKDEPKRTYIREWRNSPKNAAGRKLTLEELAERLTEAQGLSITHTSLSRIERGKQPYSEPVLMALAAELTRGDVASLLIRNPDDPEGIWSIWDRAKPGERRMIVDIAHTILKTGT